MPVVFTPSLKQLLEEDGVEREAPDDAGTEGKPVRRPKRGLAAGVVVGTALVAALFAYRRRRD